MNKLLPLLLLLTACNPLRHYNAVRDDKHRNDAELNILAPVCRAEFPFVPGTPVTITETVNDTAYTKWLEQEWNNLKDSLAVATPVVITPTDTTYIVKYKNLPAPPPIIKTVEKNVPVEDKAVTRNYQQQLEQARKEYTDLSEKFEKKSNTIKTLWIILSVIGSLGVVAAIIKLKII